MKPVSDRPRTVPSAPALERDPEAMEQRSPASLFQADAGGACVYVNGRWRELSGLTAEQALGAGWAQALHPDDRERVLAAWSRAASTASPFADDYRFRHPDGTVVWVSGQAMPEVDEHGAVVAFIGSVTDVSERKRVEERLRQSEERYRTLVERIDQGFCVIELLYGVNGRPLDYRFLEVNPTFERHTGLKDAVGKTARELVPGLEQHWIEVYGRVAETGESYRFEQGSEAMGRWFEVDAAPIDGEGSRKVALLFTDVSERKRAEETLRGRAWQDAFRTALADALRPLTDPHAIQAEASRVLGEHLGVTRAFFAEAEADGAHVVLRQDYHDGVPSAAGRYRLDDFGPDLAEAFRAGRTLVVDDVATVGGLTAEERATYAATDARAHVTVCLVKAGRLVSLLGVRHAKPRAWTAVEVALLEETAERTWAAVEHAHAEAALRHSERRLRLGIEVAGFALAEIDYAENVIHLSAEAARLYGVGQEAVTIPRERIHATFHPDERDDLVRRIARSPDPDARETYTTEYRVVWPSGETRWLSVRKRMVFDRSGSVPRPEGAMLAALDISERKRAEAERVTFVDAAAHDLRNPLTSLKAQAQLLLRRARRGQIADATALEPGLLAIDASASRMVALIDEMMDAAHLRAGRSLDLRLAPTDLMALARTVVEETRRSTSRHMVRIEAEMPNLTGDWDENRLGRVLGNLLGNAVKYSPRGGEIVVRVGREDDAAGAWAVLSVSDQGMGIPAADLERLFERFLRGRNVAAIGGAGIGLAGAKLIVEQHGGTVTVVSEEGCGSTFTVRLPIIL